jgi:NAD(P)-dependent dehydrogenase (short-subunit alcohol dehydrogenase family)
VFAGVISKDTDGAKELDKEFKDRMFTVPMNITSDEEVTSAMELVQKNLPAGGLWAVITNAGWSTFGEVEMVPIDVYQKIMDINLFGKINKKIIFVLMKPLKL